LALVTKLQNSHTKCTLPCSHILNVIVSFFYCKKQQFWQFKETSILMMDAIFDGGQKYRIQLCHGTITTKMQNAKKLHQLFANAKQRL